MDLRSLFTPEAGQDRRAWLDGVDQRLGEGMDYYLGPTGIPNRVRNLASVFEMFSPAADVADAYDASGRLMRARSVPEGATAGAGMATALASLFVPGNQRAIAQGLDGLGTAARRFGMDESGALMSRSDASDIFGPGTNRLVYQDSPTGGTMEILERDGGPASVLELFVPENMRGQGGGKRLLEEAMQNHPRMMGQVSSKAAAKNAYEAGRRPINNPNATLEDVFRMIDADSSVNLVSPAELSARGVRSETPAQEVARMLREGRAAEVADDMMARVDPQEMHRLYESGATGQAMPMDGVSRMARAREMGFDTDTPLYHGTRKDFPAFDNNAARTTDHGWYGDGTYFGAADTADAYAQAERWNGRTIPAYASGRRMQWPEGQAPAMTPQDAAGIRQGVTQQGYSGIDINAPNDFDTWGDAAGKWRETVIFDPANIRSRFARFDPRLKHLSNLSAGVGGLGLTGLFMGEPTE